MRSPRPTHPFAAKLNLTFSLMLPLMLAQSSQICSDTRTHSVIDAYESCCIELSLFYFDFY